MRDVKAMSNDSRSVHGMMHIRSMNCRWRPRSIPPTPVCSAGVVPLILAVPQ